MTFTPEVWDGVVRRLRLELPAFVCEAWIENLVAVPDGDAIRISCPTSFHRDRIRDHYLTTIASSLAAEAGVATMREVSITLRLTKSSTAPTRKPRSALTP